MKKKEQEKKKKERKHIKTPKMTFSFLFLAPSFTSCPRRLAGLIDLGNFHVMVPLPSLLSSNSIWSFHCLVVSPLSFMYSVSSGSLRMRILCLPSVGFQ